jgi:hypothetical protein
MDDNTKTLLKRWQALRDGAGLDQVSSRLRVFWILGCAFCFVAVFGIFYGWPVIIVAVAAAAAGWLIAETNALRSRLRQWPFFQRYIDWRRIDEDLSSSDT